MPDYAGYKTWLQMSRLLSGLIIDERLMGLALRLVLRTNALPQILPGVKRTLLRLFLALETLPASPIDE